MYRFTQYGAEPCSSVSSSAPRISHFPKHDNGDHANVARLTSDFSMTLHPTHRLILFQLKAQHSIQLPYLPHTHNYIAEIEGCYSYQADHFIHFHFKYMQHFTESHWKRGLSLLGRCFTWESFICNACTKERLKHPCRLEP